MRTHDNVNLNMAICHVVQHRSCLSGVYPSVYPNGLRIWPSAECDHRVDAWFPKIKLPASLLLGTIDQRTPPVGPYWRSKIRIQCTHWVSIHVIPCHKCGALTAVWGKKIVQEQGRVSSQLVQRIYYHSRLHQETSQSPKRKKRIF